MSSDPHVKWIRGIAADRAEHLMWVLPAAEETPGDQRSDSQQQWPKRGKNVCVCECVCVQLMINKNWLKWK